MAEGLLRGMVGDRFDVFSTGTEATRVRPEAISVVAEIGVDISAQESEKLERYLGEPLDLVIAICDDANGACPIFPGARERLHCFLPDPSTPPVATKAACGRFGTCGMRSEPVSRANWRRQGCDPNLAPS
jgi:protein-tyrosine-phosphatase